MSTDLVPLIGLGVQSLATLSAVTSAVIATRTLNNARKENEKQNRPYVRARFRKGLQETSKTSIYLVVENIGETTAQEVQVTFSPKLPVADHAVNTVVLRSIQDRYASPTRTLAPGEKLTNVWWTLVLEKSGDLLPPDDVQVRVTYRDLGDTLYRDTFDISTSVLKAETRHAIREEDPSKRIARALEDISYEIWDR